MENLIYELMYDKKKRRMMLILSVLNKNGGAVTLATLAEELHVSKKTLLSDIELLADSLPADYELRLRDTDLSIRCDNQKLIQDYINELAEDSVLFTIVEKILYDEIVTVHELAEETYLSESSIRKRIAYFNKTLKLFHLQMSSYNIQLVGDESDIRYFLHAFYTEFRQLFKLYPEHARPGYHDSFTRMRLYMVEHHYPMVNTSYFKITHWLLVTRIRIACHKYVRITNQDLACTVQKSERYREFREAYLIMDESERLPDDFPEDEIIWAFIASLDTVIYSERERRLPMQRPEVRLLRDESALYHLIYTVAGQLDLLGDGQFFTVHFAYLRNLSLLSALSPVFQKSSLAVMSLAKRRIRRLFHLWRETLSEEGHELPFAIEYLDDVCANLAMITSQFNAFKSDSVRKIICSFSGEAGLTAYLETTLKQYVNDKIEIAYVVNQRITAELVANLQADLIICNYVLSDPRVTVPIYRMSYIPEPNDWEVLKKYIGKL